MSQKTYYQKNKDIVLNRAKAYYENIKKILRERAKIGTENYLQMKEILKNSIKRIDIII